MTQSKLTGSRSLELSHERSNMALGGFTPKQPLHGGVAFLFLAIAKGGIPIHPRFIVTTYGLAALIDEHDNNLLPLADFTS